MELSEMVRDGDAVAPMMTMAVAVGAGRALYDLEESSSSGAVPHPAAIAIMATMAMSARAVVQPTPLKNPPRAVPSSGFVVNLLFCVRMMSASCVCCLRPGRCRTHSYNRFGARSHPTTTLLHSGSIKPQKCHIRHHSRPPFTLSLSKGEPLRHSRLPLVIPAKAGI